MKRLLLIALVNGLVGACAAPPGEGDSSSALDLGGRWRAVLASPGGELPFALDVRSGGEGWSAVAISGAEEEPFSGVVPLGDGRVRFELSWYDAEIEARLTGDGVLEGRWRKTAAEGKDSTLPFVAERGPRHRFSPEPAPLVDVSGAWTAEFTDEHGTFPARAELHQEEARVEGTFLTPTGDYRFLEGEVDGERLRLSTFDGAHAFLFDAHLQEDGSLRGDFWSRDTYRATWVAVRASPDDALPDPFGQVGLTNEDGRFTFSFPDLEGRPVSLQDPELVDRPVLIDIFGSWCPNCNDAAPLIREWAETYGPRGLAVVGLAYEYTGDAARDAEMVRRYMERHDLSYLHLLAGTSDKAKASETLPDLTEILAFPTLVFLDRDHRVVRIYSGFSGPGTGRHFDLLREQLEEILDGLVQGSAQGS